MALWITGLLGLLTWDLNAARTPQQVLEYMRSCPALLSMVLGQGPFVTSEHFRSDQKIFKELGISYESFEQHEIPFFIGPNLAWHVSLTTRTVSRRGVTTTFYDLETKVGVPHRLADSMSQKGFWPADPEGKYFGVVTPEINDGQTRGLAELVRVEILQAGYGHALKETIAGLTDEGHTEFQRILDEAILFYIDQIERRSWSAATKIKLVEEYYKFSQLSQLAISRHAGKIVGMQQNIRAPFGRRTVFKKDSLELNPLSDDFGIFGEALRKFGFFNVDAFMATDEDLYHWALQHPQSDGSLRLLTIPVEEKAKQQGIILPRVATKRTQLEGKIGDQEVVVVHGEGEIDETARFAIDKNLNPTIFVEAMTQLLANAIDVSFSADYNRNARLHYSYNDHPELFEWAGYRETGDVLMIDGKRWPITVATGAQHIDALLGFDRHLEDGDQRVLREIQNVFSRFLQ